jgi:hypothetical protein
VYIGKVYDFLILRFEQVLKEDRVMRGLTGLNLVEFEELLPAFERILFKVSNLKDRS